MYLFFVWVIGTSKSIYTSIQAYKKLWKNGHACWKRSRNSKLVGGHKERQLRQATKELNMDYEDVNISNPIQHEIDNKNGLPNELGMSFVLDL